jgi:nicotinamidase-related amidase
MEFKIKVIIFRHNSALVAHIYHGHAAHAQSYGEKEKRKEKKDLKNARWNSHSWVNSIGAHLYQHECTLRHNIQMKS